MSIVQLNVVLFLMRAVHGRCPVGLRGSFLTRVWALSRGWFEGVLSD